MTRIIVALHCSDWFDLNQHVRPIRPAIISNMGMPFAAESPPSIESSTVLILERLPLFDDLGSASISRLARSATEMSLPQGSVIFRQGDPPAGLYFIACGQVKMSLHMACGDEKVIELVGRGESMGAVPLFLDDRHDLTAETIADSELVQIAKSAVLEEAKRNPEFSYRMLKEVCQRLHQRTRDLEYRALNGAQRVTTFLLSQIPDGVNGRNVAVTLPAKKGIIASRLNLTHEHFSRILRDIQSAGLIEVRGREIRMIDVGRLRAYPG